MLTPARPSSEASCRTPLASSSFTTPPDLCDKSVLVNARSSLTTPSLFSATYGSTSTRAVLHAFFDGTHLELHLELHQTGLMDRKLYLPHDELERYECDEVLGGWEKPFSRSVSMWLVGSNRREGAFEEGWSLGPETIQNLAEETLKLLSYKPDRLGHATFLNDEAIAITSRSKWQ
ncbi:hypothetical protein GALMADRAFT_137549 [Galerina marginata CBS 339.88]|uniref:Uncharacterized protein n=1 Tax=Galerina marginata (strain CBS 339.88) TaxID=685588 RepID=A0A067T5V8_GALM3|nr:hypothetical protein GALMADRAFT_137549 [Galerina marginata CBS 339.88]